MKLGVCAIMAVYHLPFIHYWMGGGAHQGKTCLNLFTPDGGSVQTNQHDGQGRDFVIRMARGRFKELEAFWEWAYEPQVNHSVSYSALLDYMVELFMNTGEDEEETLEE